MHQEIPPLFSRPEQAQVLALEPGLQTGELPARPHHLAVDTTLPYSTGHRSGACRLRVFVPPAGEVTEQHPAVALVTEQPEREGLQGTLSVTNGIESIAQAICCQCSLPPQRIILIEHYDDRKRGLAARLPGRIGGEKFSGVVFGSMQAVEGEPGAFELRRPQWHSLGKAEVEALIGQHLL
jgi:hypothetical protein